MPNQDTLTSNSLVEVSYWNGSGWVSRNMRFGQLVTQLENELVDPAQSAFHMRRNDMFQVWDQVSSNRNVRFLNIGDSVTHANETTRGVRLAFDGYMDKGGYRTMFTENAANTGDHLLFYFNLTPAYSSYSPSYYCPMVNGQVTTSTFNTGSSPVVDTLDFDYHSGSELGSYLIETNGGAGYGTLATVDATVGTQGAFQTVRYALNPVTNYNVRVTSTGSNNFVNIGLTRLNGTTNSHTWARMAKPGQLISEVITNAGFWKFYTNYSPHAIFLEAKDPWQNQLEAMLYARANFTNSALVWITSSPAPDGGAKPARDVMIDFSRTNAGTILFDKYALFEPTNYWYNAMPFGAGNIWADSAHLGAKGIHYASTAFAHWFGAGEERFRMAGLKPRVDAATLDISGKANLAGGNSFSGQQNFSTHLFVSNGVVLLRGDANNAQFQIWSPTQPGTEVTRINRANHNEVIGIRSSQMGNIAAVGITNAGGVARLGTEATALEVGAYGTVDFIFRTNAAPGDTGTVDAWLPVKGTNGVTYYLPAYQ